VPGVCIWGAQSQLGPTSIGNKLIFILLSLRSDLIMNDVAVERFTILRLGVARQQLASMRKLVQENL